MKIRPETPEDREQLVGLVAGFRGALAELSGNAGTPSRERAEAGTVWAESLYVDPECRRQNIASLLYAEAERLAEELGSDTVYNWVHPNNHAVVSFLKRRGYDVLNLIEVRRAGPDEKPAGTMRVGSEEFRY